MTIWERFKTAVAAFRDGGGLGLPEGGRSSEESLGDRMSMFNSAFSSINPVVDFETLKTLKNLWLYNPDVSQYAANIVNLGNPGHQIVIDAANDAKAEAALNRINESASRIYDHGCGVDGLINQYLGNLAWSGAISSEDVVNLAARRVEKVVMVPVEQIRFKYNQTRDTYEPYQRTTNFLRQRRGDLGLIPLNQETYKYYALSTVENSPYAKPPAVAAVEAILQGQVPIMENLQFMAQKYGLLGFVDYSAMMPTKQPGESVDEHRRRCTQFIKDTAKALEGSLSKGMLVHAKDATVKHEPVTTGASGVYDMNRISEEQVFSGLGAMPGFHGRTDSTTETFADVVYYLLTAQVTNLQRVVKRRQEQTYRLDLRLGGIEVDGISLQFNKAHSRNAKAEAETDEIVLRTVMTKIKSGLISPDEGAQELGYDAFADVAMLTSESGVVSNSFGWAGARGREGERARKSLTMLFDKQAQKYVYKPEVIQLTNGNDDILPGETVIPFIKKKALAASN